MQQGQIPATKGIVYPAGATVIDTAESRLNNAYGLMTTPDRVQNVIVPTNGLLFVQYEALWKEALNGGGSAAIFIGANQLKVRDHEGTVGKIGAQSAAHADVGSTTNFYAMLFTCSIGLATKALDSVGATEDPAPVTTGMAMGLSVSHGVADPVTWRIDDVDRMARRSADGTGSALGGMYGGICCIHNLAAGTYDVSIQFKNTAPTGAPGVTVKNRRLRVWTMEF